MAQDCANPLLATWLKEWMDQAKERNTKGYTVYKKAYQSIIACPLRFQHPSEAQQLSGLGPKLCDRLTDNLKKFCEENGLPMPSKGRKRKRPSEALTSEPTEPEQISPVRKPRKAQNYVPKLRSGAYALVMALATLDQEANEAIPRDRLIELAQPLCDASFTAPSDPTKFFTAWNSIKTLESKELVCTKGHPVKKYYLSDDGWEVALRMQAAQNGQPLSPAAEKKKKNAAVRDPSLVRDSSPKLNLRRPPLAVPSSAQASLVKSRTASDVVDLLSSSDSEPPRERPVLHDAVLDTQHLLRRPSLSWTFDDFIVLPPGSFEVKMVLDMREVRTTTDRDYISAELKKLGVVPIIRSLPLGDILWVAVVSSQYSDQLKAANIADDEEGNLEIVLEHIMERKRLDDLIYSIKDGRFHEQKFRLSKSGIKYVTYLIEEYSLSAERSDKYGEALESAIASMQVVNGYFVKQTAKLDDTIQYLSRMTKTLKSMYEKKDVYVVPCQALEVEAVSMMLERVRTLAPERIIGMTFPVFGAMCDKSDSMTLRDVFLKMLMTTRGVTGEKAVEIQKIWPTPRAFTEAYSGLDRGPARDNMVSDRLGNAIPRKKIAKTLSAKIAEVWG
ncbi:uncharacterized protein A1O9_02961 [Exophiala aquamarina CBS 119918]|uniref:Crossover junction endonuclease MUS81 n=1 Tax=Exophiala aquamarina CBS 119918 TaxID=1182545 RepID=A0A072Q0I7_9EURO|nr:uncharacterized protein A1O9_02961 [Exophiala aquamarina CBS 119918]KEF61395.1 hypothetical protein A1O9_02961 [Exophiala aquamarina CBS 119918]